MKHRAIVTDVNDPENLFRLQARVIGFGEDDNENKNSITPWCWPCVPMAAGESGLCFMPPVGAEVWIEQVAGGAFAWTGCFWSERNKLPGAVRTPDVRVLRTPAGHEVLLDENGDVRITHATGGVIALRKNGDVDVTVDGNANVTAGGKVEVTGPVIELNGADGGVVTTKHPCIYNGAPHPVGSITVKAGG